VKTVLAPFPASKSQCDENQQGWDLPSFGVITECITGRHFPSATLAKMDLYLSFYSNHLFFFFPTNLGVIISAVDLLLQPVNHHV